MNIGIIGFGKHAKRIVSVIEQDIGLKGTYVLFNHRQNAYDDCLEQFQATERIDDLLSKDFIIIASPNDTHVNYLKILLNHGYRGYIVCEKPPASNIDDLNYLKGISEQQKKKIYFNFQYRCSDYRKIIENASKKYELGRMVAANIIQCHGLGFKEEYSKNWRSKIESHQGGIFENLLIHYLDLFIVCFGEPSCYVNYASSLSPLGNSMDNSCFVCQFSNKVSLSVTLSYTAPAIRRFLLIFENGYIEIDNNLTVYGPRDVFNEDGNFVNPPMICQERGGYDIAKVSKRALINSIQNFVDHVSHKRLLDESLFDQSLLTNEIVLDKKIIAC